jgi:hypothetical protein
MAAIGRIIISEESISQRDFGMEKGRPRGMTHMVRRSLSRREKAPSSSQDRKVSAWGDLPLPTR